MVERGELLLYKEGEGRRSSIEVMSTQDETVPTPLDSSKMEIDDDNFLQLTPTPRTPVTSTPYVPEEKSAPRKERRRRRKRRLSAIPCDVAEVPQAPKKKMVRRRSTPLPVPCDVAEEKRSVGGRSSSSITLTVCPPAPTSQRVRLLPYRIDIRRLEL